MSGYFIGNQCSFKKKSSLTFPWPYFSSLFSRPGGNPGHDSLYTDLWYDGHNPLYTDLWYDGHDPLYTDLWMDRTPFILTCGMMDMTPFILTCGMMDMAPLSWCRPRVLISTPSIDILPDGSAILNNMAIKEDLPAPVRPTTPIWKIKRTLFKRRQTLIHGENRLQK